MPLTVAGRLAGLPDPAVAAQPALDLGLVDSESGGWVAFRHPLVRSAVYEALPVPRRRRLHAAAAGTVDGDAALAHRVAAAEDADGCFAAELDRSARRHGSRGAHILAAEQLLQAAAWSETVADQQRRLLTACVEFLDAFEYRRVYALGEQIERCAPGPLRSFVLAHLAGMTQSSGFADIVAHSRDVLDGPQENTDRDISARAALSVARIYSFTGRWDDAARLAGQAGALANDPGLALRVRCFRSWAIGLTQGPVAGLALLGDEPDIAAMRPVARSELLLARGILRVHTGDFVGARLDLTTAVSRPNGSATLFWWLGHYHLVLLSYLTGAWAECDAYARLVLDMSVVQFADGDAAIASAAMALAPAGRGDVEVAGHWVGRAAGLLTARALSSQATPVRFSEALIARARGDYAAVLAALSEPPDGSWYPLGGAWNEALLIEALIETGRLEAAGAALDGLAAGPEEAAYQRAVRHGLRGRLLARTGEVSAAQRQYEAALAVPPERSSRLDRALAAQWYGESLLGTDHRRAVRMLRAALREFTNLGADPYLRRCEAELRHAERATPLLSDRERQVAELVGQGMTNREIAAELSVSAKTVEYHLAKIFAKLAFTSRRELRSAVTGGLPGSSAPVDTRQRTRS